MWNIALNPGHWDTRSWTKSLSIRYTCSQICKWCSLLREKQTIGMRKTDAQGIWGCSWSRQKYKALICSRIAGIAAVLPEVWPWGEMAEVAEVASRLSQQFPQEMVEAATWKVVADAAAQGHLLLDLEQYTLSRTLPLAVLPPDATVLVHSPLPDTLLPES